MTIYSAHDTTVFSMLAALNATPHAELPGFTSNVVMELWEAHDECTESHDFHVHILYHPFPYDSPRAHSSDGFLTNCPLCQGGKCKLDDFVTAAANSMMAPEDCDRRPHLKEPEDTQCCAAAS
jgi:hypothetical protein